MRRMKRKELLTAIRAAGYHGDRERGTLLYVKNWVSLQVFDREFDAGMAMRQNGVPCECVECKSGKTEPLEGLRSRLPERCQVETAGAVCLSNEI